MTVSTNVETNFDYISNKSWYNVLLFKIEAYEEKS